MGEWLRQRPAYRLAAAFLGLSQLPLTAARSAAKPPYIGEKVGSVLTDCATFPRR